MSNEPDYTTVPIKVLLTGGKIAEGSISPRIYPRLEILTTEPLTDSLIHQPDLEAQALYDALATTLPNSTMLKLFRAMRTGGYGNAEIREVTANANKERDLWKSVAGKVIDRLEEKVGEIQAVVYSEIKTGKAEIDRLHLELMRKYDQGAFDKEMAKRAAVICTACGQAGERLTRGCISPVCIDTAACATTSLLNKKQENPPARAFRDATMQTEKAGIESVRPMANQIKTDREMSSSWFGNQEREALICKILWGARDRAETGHECAFLLAEVSPENRRYFNKMEVDGLIILESYDFRKLSWDSTTPTPCHLIYPTVKLMALVETHLNRSRKS